MRPEDLTPEDREIAQHALLCGYLGRQRRAAWRKANPPVNKGRWAKGHVPWCAGLTGVKTKDKKADRAA